MNHYNPPFSADVILHHQITEKVNFYQSINFKIMKNQILIVAFALALTSFGINHASAQNAATATVNITLADVISIDQSASNAAGGVVNFNYATAEDYNSDQSVNVPTSLVVTSTTNFDVSVKAGGSSFLKGSDEIPVNVLTIKPVSGGSTTMTSGTMQNVELSTQDQVLVENTNLGSKKVLELEYFIPASKSSSPDILGKPEGTYTQTVTYTATAQ